MKKTITKQEQSRINELLKARKQRELTISQQRERLSMYEQDNYVRKDGRTCLESKHLEDLSL